MESQKILEIVANLMFFRTMKANVSIKRNKPNIYIKSSHKNSITIDYQIFKNRNKNSEERTKIILHLIQ